MAIYYFHLRDGIDVLLDPEGRKLDDGAIPAAAITEARAIIAADAVAGHILLDQRIEVQDADGNIVHRLRFEDAVRITHEAVRAS
jgi:hypothetical protein